MVEYSNLEFFFQITPLGLEGDVRVREKKFIIKKKKN